MIHAILYIMSWKQVEGVASQEVLGNTGGATDTVIFAKEKKEKLLQASFTAAHLGKFSENEMVFSRNPACPLSVISDYGLVM